MKKISVYIIVILVSLISLVSCATNSGKGGFVSSLVAAELKDKIKNLIMLYPALCIPDNWQVNFPKEEDIPESYNFWNREK